MDIKVVTDNTNELSVFVGILHKDTKVHIVLNDTKEDCVVEILVEGNKMVISAVFPSIISFENALINVHVGVHP